MASMNSGNSSYVDRRMVRKGSHAVVQIRVVWSHLPEDAATWEDYEVMKKRFPDALDWGQSNSSEGVMSGVLLDYWVINCNEDVICELGLLWPYF